MCGCTPSAGLPTNGSPHLRDDVAKLLEAPPPSQQYYLAVLAAIDWLDNEPEMRAKEIADELLVRELERDDRSPEARTLALSLVSPDNKFLTLDRLRAYLQAEYEPLRLEARAVARAANRIPSVSNCWPQRLPMSRKTTSLRAEAIAGLAPRGREASQFVGAIGRGRNKRCCVAKPERVLRLATVAAGTNGNRDPRPTIWTAWNKLLTEAGRCGRGPAVVFQRSGAAVRRVPSAQRPRRADRAGPHAHRTQHHRASGSSRPSCSPTRKLPRSISRGCW